MSELVTQGSQVLLGTTEGSYNWICNSDLMSDNLHDAVSWICIIKYHPDKDLKLSLWGTLEGILSWSYWRKGRLLTAFILQALAQPLVLGGFGQLLDLNFFISTMKKMILNNSASQYYYYHNIVIITWNWFLLPSTAFTW